MRTSAHRPTMRVRRAAVAAATFSVAATALVLVGLGTAAGASTTDSRLAEQPAPATTFEVSSFNLLGAAHTAPGGNKPGYASGTRRMDWAISILEEGGVDVVGFQEMEQPQFERFKELRGTEYGIYPGMRFDRPALSNSIAWRKDTWTRVSASTFLSPYFHGNLTRKPLVLLQHVQTGQLAYFMNTHNPANVRGPAQKWRDAAVQIQVDLVNRLRAETPTIPVFFTGDMNDREKFFCPVTAASELQAANGGTNIDGVCTPPVPTKIDWIMGTRDATFTGYLLRDDALVDKTTDHPVVLATASIPPIPMQESQIRRVVVLDVEGLSSRAVRRAGELGAPRLHQMMREGASTLNARTAVERTTLLPNVVGMLTGRRVSAADGGHGVTRNLDDGVTVRSTAGRYVSSTYDLVHNFGRSTALFSSRAKMALVARSWDDTNGGLDPFGVDDGRAKISRVVRTETDLGLVRRLTAVLARAPKTFTLAHISQLADVGRERGWMRPRFMSTVTEVDAMVGRVLDTVATDPDLRDTTLVVLTADGGGVGNDPSDPTLPGNYVIPFVVWGHGVVPGADLYAINPAYVDPGTAQAGYTGSQPIRNATVANLVTAVLGLPAIPGSEQNARQDFNIFVGAEPATTE